MSKINQEKQKIEREIKEQELILKKYKEGSEGYYILCSDIGALKSKLLGFNLAKECVLEDVREIIDELDSEKFIEDGYFNSSLKKSIS